LTRVPRLVRRRELWLPTIWGWALIAGVAAGAGWLGVHEAYGFLAPNQPVNRGLLVVEGWVNDAALAETARLWRTGAYERLVTTGGPIERYASIFPFANYAEQAAETLEKHERIPAAEITVVPAPSSNRERTFASAVALREWLARNRVDTPEMDVLSEGPHARRTWILYRAAFGANVTIGIRSVMSDLYQPATWWQSSAGAKEVLTEAIAWLWVKCCFHAFPSKSPGESDLTGTGGRDVGLEGASAPHTRSMRAVAGALAFVAPADERPRR
jgi:hypothetical protein